MLVLPQNISIIKGTKKVFQEGDDLQCTCCDYKYTTWDMMLSIAHLMMEESAKE